MNRHLAAHARAALRIAAVGIALAPALAAAKPAPSQPPAVEDAAASAEPEPPDAAAARIDAMLRQGQVPEALAAAASHLSDHPDDLDVWEHRIDILANLGRVESVLDQLKARTTSRPTADAFYLLGRALPDRAESEDAYKQALKLSPQHARAHMGIGALARADGRLRDAAEAYQQALRVDVSLAEAWSGLLSVVVAGGEARQIEAIATAAREAVPSEPNAYIALATLNSDEAGEILRDALRRCHPDPRIHTALAEQLLREGNGREARSQAEAALRLDPTNRGARLARYLARGLALEQLDTQGVASIIDARRTQATNPSTARARYDVLTARYPRSPLPRLLRAGVRAEKEPLFAIDDLEVALQLDPELDEVKAALGMLYLQHNRPSRAAELLGEAALARPDDASLAEAAATASLKAGELEDAVDRINYAAGLFPLDARIAIRQADVLMAADRREEAWRAMHAAAQRIPDIRVMMAKGTLANELGRTDEAIHIYTTLAEQTGNEKLRNTAERMRQQAESRDAP